MKTMCCRFFLLATIGAHLSVLGAVADPPGGAKRADGLVVYPWSDTSACVRLPKSFLHDFSMWSILVGGQGTRLCEVSDEFIQLCALTAVERARVNSSLSNALHIYLAAQAEQWAPSDEKAPLNRRMTTLEQFDFTREPLLDKRDATYQNLEREIRAVLGPERAELFWELADPLRNGVFGFADENKPLPGTQIKTIHTFLLVRLERGLDVLLQSATSLGGYMGYGDRMKGASYPAAFDRYAPKSMQPVLARWRKTIADSQGPRAAEPGNSVHLTEGSAAGDPGGGAIEQAPLSKWEDGVPFVDVPKALIPDFHVIGLTSAQQLSDEATIAFGLTEAERKKLDALFLEMKTRFEVLERSHFRRAGPGKNQYFLEAFPEEAKALREEWVHRLRGVVGAGRFEMLVRTIEKPVYVSFKRGVVVDALLQDPEARVLQGPVWLYRGTVGVRLRVQVEVGVDGQPAIQFLEWDSDNGELMKLGGGPVPPRWRHLLTPDMLKP